MNKLKEIVSKILAKREEMPIERSLLVGISGIDTSGKGFVAAKLIEEMQKQNINVAVINADDRVNLPHIRFN